MGEARRPASSGLVWAAPEDTVDTPGVMIWDLGVWAGDELVDVDGGTSGLDGGTGDASTGDAGLDGGVADASVDAGAQGCDANDPGRNPSNPDPIDVAGYDSNCDMVDGVLGSMVFVSPSGDDASSGASPDVAVRTIARAIGLAAPRKLAVLIAGQDAGGRPAPAYDQASPLVLESGVSLHGGYASTFRARFTDGALTILAGGANPLVRASGITQATLLQGLVIRGSDVGGVGQASIAMRIEASGDFVSFERAEIRAGRGGDGSNGTTGPAIAGYAGGAGGLSRGCGQGEASGTQGAGPSAGAAGANAADTCVNFWGSCLPANARGAQGAVGGRGGDGAQGASGAVSANTLGLLDANGWSGVTAGAGSAGQGGSGGGGGGAGGDVYQNYCWGCRTNLLGASGGRGQRGGPGGGAGLGGAQGGASIALLVVDSSVTLVDTTVVLGTGGNGGRGGNGGLGQSQPWEDPGTGATQTSGCVGSTYVSGAGSAGGIGGRGGHGGGGGGGNGGPVIGIARVRSAVAGAPTFTAGSPGAGGAGGTNGWGGSAPSGNAGAVQTIW